MISKNKLKGKIQQHQKIRELASSNKNVTMPATRIIVKNFGKSVVTNVKSVIGGNSLNVTEEEKSKRLEICKGCQFFEKSTERCSKCGCYLSLKTYLKAERCPIGKW